MVFNECTRYLWARLFEKKLFTDHPLRESRRIVFGEDQLLSYHSALHVRKAVSIDVSVYDYYQYQASLTGMERGKIAKSFKDRVLVNSLSLDLLSGQERAVVDKEESDIIRLFFNMVKKGHCSRDVLMATVKENSLAGLLSIANLRRHLGLRKALVYWATLHLDFFPKALLGD